MAIPVYLWIEDDGHLSVKGGVDISGREGAIEILELMHAVEQPIDSFTGKIVGKRQHSTYAFMKEIDSSSSFFYKALSTGQTFTKAIFDFYRINFNGAEELYFKTTLENVKVTEVEPFILDVKNPNWEKHNHLEYVDLSYEKITWHYVDGNIVHSVLWTVRN